MVLMPNIHERREEPKGGTISGGFLDPRSRTKEIEVMLMLGPHEALAINLRHPHMRHVQGARACIFFKTKVTT